MKPSSKAIPLTSHQYRLLAVLALITFVNFADRQVIVPLLPLRRQRLGVDAQLSSLQTWLLLVLAMASVPAGYFADCRALLMLLVIYFVRCDRLHHPRLRQLPRRIRPLTRRFGTDHPIKSGERRRFPSYRECLPKKRPVVRGDRAASGGINPVADLKNALQALAAAG